MLAAHQRAARHRGSESSSVPAVGSIVAVHSGATGARAMIETVRERGVCRADGKPLASAEGWDRLYVNANKTSRDVALRTLLETKLIQNAVASKESQQTPQAQQQAARRLSTPKRRFADRRTFAELEPTGMFRSTNLEGRQGATGVFSGATPTQTGVFGATPTRSTPSTRQTRIGGLMSHSAMHQLSIHKSAMAEVYARREEEDWSAKNPMAVSEELMAKRNPAQSTVGNGTAALEEGGEAGGAPAAALEEGGEAGQAQPEEQAATAQKSSFLSPTKASAVSAWRYVQPPEEKKVLKYMNAASQEMVAAKGEVTNGSLRATKASKGQLWATQQKKESAPKPKLPKFEYMADHSKEILAGKETENGYYKPTSNSKYQTWEDKQKRASAPWPKMAPFEYMAAHSKEILEGKFVENHSMQATKASKLKPQVGPAATKYGLIDPAKLSGIRSGSRTRGFRLDRNSDGETRKLM
jgi:hypothetical protein